MSHDEDTIRQQVRQGYAAIATATPQPGNAATGCCSGSSCCGADDPEAANELARRVGYDLAELQNLPEGANMGLSCGNPVALASLAPSEVVVDLGSGGGFDVFLAGPRVGATGRAIGVDMTPEMLAKARCNVAAYTQRTGLTNVEFRLGEIEALPLGDGSADVIISNCVVNLSPAKERVWAEMARVLRPGGRVAVSDIALRRALPAAIVSQVEALVGCVAGAVLVRDTERMARAAGFTDIVLEEKPGYVEAMEQWQDPLYKEVQAALPEGARLADYVVSLNVAARKPLPGEVIAPAAAPCCGPGCC